MYNLRSRKISNKITSDIDMTVTSNKKRRGTQLNNGKKKIQRLSDDVINKITPSKSHHDKLNNTADLQSKVSNKNHQLSHSNGKSKLKEPVDEKLYDPKLFTKRNGYIGIYDSSDSDSDEEIIYHNEDEEFLPNNEADECEEETEEAEDEEEDDKEETEDETDEQEDEEEDEEEELNKLAKEYEQLEEMEREDLLDDIDIDEEGHLDETFNPDKDEYFEIYANPLVGIIAKHLKAKFPDLEEDDLNSAIKRALNRAKSDLVDEYCGAVPKDTSWKAELDSAEVKKLEPELKQLRKNIKDNTPTLPKILKSGLSTFEKERCLQLYDILKNTEPYTTNYMFLSLKISNMIRTAPAVSELDSDTNDELRKLQAKMESQTPTVEKIMAARITESDKMRALQLYEELQHCEFNCETWFCGQRDIRSILDAQLPTIEDVERFEAEEQSMRGMMINFNVDLKRKIFELDADVDVKSRIYEMYCEMISSNVSNSRYSDLKEKILWAVRLPYRRTLTSESKTNTPEDISIHCREVYHRLDDEIYGMKDAKERVIQVVNDRIYNPNSHAILALKGKPGVGKTKLAKTIAKAMGLPFDKISLGGALDSTIFKGSDGVWSGAGPSMLLQILSRVKYSNAVILLDEIDKLGTSERGMQVQHALLHVLDPTQNKEFQDAFLCEFSHDISKIFFIPAMNDDSQLDHALKDRLNIIEIPSYTRKDMIQITQNFTLPEALIDKGIQPGNITITDDGVCALLNLLGREVDDTGMRPVERAINDMVSKINLIRSLSPTGNQQDLPLTFKLLDFKGFPYIMTPNTVHILYKIKNNSIYESTMFT